MSLRSIYEIPPTEQFALNAGATLGTDLRWTAYACKVDNPTPQWIHIKNTLQYVPPYVTGYVVPIPSLDRAEAEWAAPPTVTQGPQLTGAQAVLTFYSYELAPSGGQIQQVAGTLPWQTPNKAFNSQLAGPNVALIEAATSGKQIYVIRGIFAVQVIAAGTFATVEETGGGRTIEQFGCDVLNDGIPFDSAGFIVASGKGVQFRVLGGATCSLSLLYSTVP